MVYNKITDSKINGRKLIAVLIDPDKFDYPEDIDVCQKAGVDFILVGGSIITNGDFNECVKRIKEYSQIPVIIFPGNYMQISKEADGILLLSLISGRNPEMLIGNHVVAAPLIKKSKIEVVPTGYMLIDSGKQTSVSYISGTFPIPYDKEDIAMATAMAGEMLGLKLIYMEAGSGALNPVSNEMIKTVKQHINIPLLVGGGIVTAQQACEVCNAGADMIVVGSVIEKDKNRVAEIVNAVHGL